LLVGTSTADDAAVYRISDELAIIQTVDFFTPIADSPYDFGAIGAANSISDVYAMGGKPVIALNIVTFPKNHPDVPMSALGEILRGGADKATEAGVLIVGGHTVDDQEPKYGLSVTGFVHPDQIWRNVGGRPGDALLVTKALGTGIISSAVRKGDATEALERAANESMAALNKTAASIAGDFRVHACTDITGFGFLGHLREMLLEGGIGARISASAIPVHEGARELAIEYAPGGGWRNRKAVESIATYAEGVSEQDMLLLCDPQTSGGLLFAMPPEDAEQVLAGLREANVPAAIVGELVDDASGRIEVSA
jgi:selenide,water dikinase